jgi:ankyrin repeat protein
MKGGCTPLIIASQNSHVEVARLLVDGGADVNKAQKDGWTPLVLARNFGHTAIVELLLEAGATE